jgi:hypothetical protein
MKKLIPLLLSILVFSQFSFAQSQRMVLAEEFTSSTCPPCAQQNPAFDALLEANSDVITSIKYHVNWPTPGNDPMYLDNPGDSQARIGYYNDIYAPWAFIDGNYYNGSPSNVSQNMINAVSAVPSPFEIQTQQTLSSGQDSVYLTTLIKATDDVSGNLRAHVVVIEKHIHFDGGAGLTNGEKDFYNVMKKMLPSSSGTVLPSSMEAGDYILLQNAWKLDNVYDINELGAVIFVQDNTSKAVHQASNSSEQPLVPAYNNDAQILSVSNATSTNCSGMTTPYVTIRNNGGTELTSLTINYSVNGGETQTYDWTGNLEFLETEVVELNEVTFDVADTNILTITGINPNESTDDYITNNTFEYMMTRAPVLTGTSIVFLTLDDHPEETTWEIKNSAGDVVQSGGPYETSGQKIEPITVSETDCYEFVIYDAGGNGTDYYAVVYGNNQVAFEGSNFGNLERNEFAYGTVSTEEIKAYADMTVYPNPVADQLKISFYMPEKNNVDLRVVDLVGKTLTESERGLLNAGPQSLTMNTSELIPGIYLLEIKIGNELYTQKISVR